MAANIFTGTTDNNWGTSTNWSLGVVPTASDGHVATFNVTSPNCTVNTSARVCNAIDFTGYTNTITMTNGITVSGNVTLDSTMASRVSGSSGLTVNATATLTSNGGTWNNDLRIGNGTFTLTDNWIILGSFTNDFGITNVYNGFSFSINGSYTQTSFTGASTTKIILTGNGNVSVTSGSQLPVDFNASGTYTMTSTWYLYGSGVTFTYISGTLNCGTQTFQVYNATLNNVSSINFYNVTFVNSGTTPTLNSNMNVTNTLTMGGSVVTGSNIYTANLTVTNTNSGTTNIIMNGTGTWSGIGTLKNNLTINTSGTITISGTVNYNTGTLTYTSGTVTTTGSTLTIAASTTLNTNGISWNNITTISVTQTWTLLSDLNLSGTINTLVASFNLTINGSFYVNNSGSSSFLNGISVNGTCLGFKMIGNGTWTNPTQGWTIPVIVDTIGYINFTQIILTNTTFTIISGSISVFSLTFSGNCTINISNPNSYRIINMTLSGTTTLRLSSDVYVDNLGYGVTGNAVTNGNNLYVYKIFNPVNSVFMSGTTTIHLVGDVMSWYGNSTVLATVSNKVNINCGRLYMGSSFGKYTSSASGYVFYGTDTLTHIKGEIITLPTDIFIVNTSATLTNFHRVNLSNVRVTAGITLTMNEFFCGRPEVKTKVISTTTANYTVTFTNPVPKKAFHVNVKNCTVTGRNQLNIINRDGNSGSNSNILFGESGMNGTNLNMFPTQTSYLSASGFKSNMNL